MKFADTFKDESERERFARAMLERMSLGEGLGGWVGATRIRGGCWLDDVNVAAGLASCHAWIGYVRPTSTQPAPPRTS